jgi:hypothetical protein
MKKNTTGITEVEFLFRTEQMFIIEAICKEHNLQLKWIAIKKTHPFQRCKISMPLAEKESISAIIRTTLLKAHNENNNIIRPENEQLN